jgi:hypothetical protein
VFLVKTCQSLSNQVFSVFSENLSILDKKYNCWQVLDDVSDLDQDLNDGILTAPVYYLIQQCKIANKIKNGSINNVQQLLQELNDSGLNIVGTGSLHSDGFSGLIRQTLANSMLDHSLTVTDIVDKYSTFLRDVEHSLTVRDFRTLRQTVLKSGVIHKLLTMPRDSNLNYTLLNQHQERLLEFINLLMSNASKRALQYYHDTKDFVSKV